MIRDNKWMDIAGLFGLYHFGSYRNPTIEDRSIHGFTPELTLVRCDLLKECRWCRANYPLIRVQDNK